MIRLSKSCLSAAEKQAVLGVLDREYLGMGAEVEQFERALSDFFGRPAACVVNGTAALHLALQVIGIEPGDEVLVPSLTYVASFQAISASGARPVACDICQETLTLDWRDAERRLTSRTRAVMPVHYAGQVGALDDVYSFARKHGLRVVEDAAHAFGTVHREQRVGGFGDIACFSFDGIKNITSGEGGCIVSNDDRVMAAVRDARLLGVEKDTEKRYSGQRSWEFDVSAQGWRYHMSNIMAAIGLEQLRRFSELAARRQELARRYVGLLRDCDVLRLLDFDLDHVVPHIFPVVLGAGCSRRDVQDTLARQGIQTGIHYQPNHLLELYRNPSQRPLPVAEDVASRLLSLPLHPDLADDDVDFVVQSLAEAVRQ